MKHSTHATRGRARVGAAVGGALALSTSILMVVFTGSASAATTVPLGTARSFAVLAGQSITNTGPSVISGDLGVSPGTAVTGFPPGLVNGSQHSADAVAAQAQSDLTAAYDNAAGQTPRTSVATELGGRTLIAGTYASATLGLTGTLTLDGQGSSDSVFLFQAGSTLITASNSAVLLINGATACNVFWQVGSSATLGTGTAFVGTILALTSISAQSGASVQGRALARNGSVTLDNNAITSTGCAPATPPTTTAPPTTTTTTTTTAPPTTTTTAPPTTTTTAPPTTTTTAPPTTTTTAPPTTTTTAPPTTTTTTPGGGGNGGGGNGGNGNGGGGNGNGGGGGGNGGGGNGGGGNGGGGNGGGGGGNGGGGNGGGGNGGGGNGGGGNGGGGNGNGGGGNGGGYGGSDNNGSGGTSSGSTTATEAPATAGDTGGTVDTGGTADTGGTGGTGGTVGTGGSAGTGGTAGLTVIPLGHPETGVGGAAHAVDKGALGLGVLALAAAAVTAGVGIRRRRQAAAGVTPTGQDGIE